MTDRQDLVRFRWFEDQVKAKQYPNATKLAGEFEIHPKTAQRAIVFMRDRLECPLVYDRIRKGYYYSNEAFSFAPIWFSAAELTSLMLARQLLMNLSGNSINKDLSAAINKISAELAKPADLGRLDNAISLRFAEYIPAPENIFKPALEGCIEKHSLRIHYLTPSSGKTSERTVDPYHLYNYKGSWHLIGFCHLKHNIRTFNLYRIKEIQLLEEKFSVTNDFNPDRYFEPSFGIYKRRKKEMVTIRVIPSKALWLQGLVWHKDQKEKTLKDGSLEISFPVSDYSEVMREILKQGAGLIVVRPERLRDLVRSEARGIAAQYQDAHS
jgi:predicted DNA-binding transcriptional regulator YafY